MLDKFTDAQDAMNTVKDKLHAMMRSEEDFNEDSYTEVRDCQMYMHAHVCALPLVLKARHLQCIYIVSCSAILH